MYPEELVKPMKEDLTKVGFEELHTSEEVDAALAKPGTTLVVVNSVCGCAAANARPGAKMSLDNAKKPDHIVTVFCRCRSRSYGQGKKPYGPLPSFFTEHGTVQRRRTGTHAGASSH